MLGFLSFFRVQGGAVLGVKFLSFSSFFFFSFFPPSFFPPYFATPEFLYSSTIHYYLTLLQ